MDDKAARILAAAMEIAKAYDLSERAYDDLFDHLIAIETALGADAPCHVDRILTEAIRRETMLYEDPLAGLVVSGAKIQRLARCFVPPQDIPLADGALEPSGDVKIDRARSAPKTKALLKRLRASGIHADDLIIYVGVVAPTMVRRLPYIIIEIPRLQKQIAVSDAMGEAAFIADSMLPLDTWTSANKAELVEEYGVTRIAYDADGRWLSEIGSHLFKDGGATYATRDAKVSLHEASNIPLLTTGMIVEWVKLFHEKVGRYPTATDQEAVWDRDGEGQWYEVPGESWHALESTLVRGRRGSATFAHKSLADLKRQHGLFEDRTLTEQRIVGWMQAFHEKEGRYPTARDLVWEKSENGWVCVEGENWNALQHCIRLQGRGLTRTAGLTLARFREQMLGVQPKQQLSYELIAEWARHFEKKVGRLPLWTDREIWREREDSSWHQVPGENWSAVFGAMTDGLRGLPCKMTLPEFREKYLAVPQRTDRSLETIRVWIECFWMKEGRVPKPRDKIVWTGANDQWRPVERENWSHVNHRILYLTRDDPRPKNLCRYAAEVVDQPQPDLGPRDSHTTARILDWARQHHVKVGTFPKSTSGAVWRRNEAGVWETIPGENWRSINRAIREGLRGLEELKGRSLRDVLHEHGLVDPDRPTTLAITAAQRRQPSD